MSFIDSAIRANAAFLRTFGEVVPVLYQQGDDPAFSLSAVRAVRQLAVSGRYSPVEEIFVNPNDFEVDPAQGDLATLGGDQPYMVISISQPDPYGLITLTLNAKIPAV